MKLTPRYAGLLFLFAASLSVLLEGCATLEPSPRFRTSSVSFAPDQLPLAERSAAELADPSTVAAYSSIKEEAYRRSRQSGTSRNASTSKDIHLMIVNQSASSMTMYVDEVGLDVEETEDELAAGEEFSANEPPLNEAVIEDIIERSYSSTMDSISELNPAVNRPELIREIVNLLGIRYRYGGTDATRGLDCSAFTGTIFSRALGVRLPRSSNQQFRTGIKVDRTKLKIGDLVFFKTLRKRAPVSHVGIYVGEENFAHASARHGVIISSLTHPYYTKTYVGARRILNPEYSQIELSR